MDHTPTPWHTGKYSMQCGASADHIYSQQSKEPSEGIARCYAWVGREEAEANAEFIVRACNSYDELLSACLGAREVLRGLGQDIPAALDNAIAIAEGREHA